MSSIRNIVEYMSYYVFGNIILNFSFTIVTMIVYRIQGAILDLYEVYISSFTNTVIIYTILFIIVTIMHFMYNKKIVENLNVELKERNDYNEK